LNIEWETPQDFFDNINKEFHFTLDVAANPENSKCTKYFKTGALVSDWSKDICWMNCPYSDPYAWVKYAYKMSQKGATVVALLRASVDTKWFHEFCMKAIEIRFVIDRIHFGRKGEFKRANHPSILVVFEPYWSGSPMISSIDRHGNKF